MDNRRADIDIAFRNGLKDFEVLPPPEVWESIQPLIKRKQRPVYILRAAALIAIVMMLSFLAYRLSNEISTEIDKPAIAVNPGIIGSGSSVDLTNPKSDISGERKVIVAEQFVTTENPPDIARLPVENIFNPPDPAILPKAYNSLTNNSSSLNIKYRIALNSAQQNSYEVNDIYEEYIPEANPINSTARWSVAAMASPTYYGKVNSGTNDLSKQLKTSEQPLISYSGGVAFSFKINKRLSIQSGLFYSSLGQEVDGISSFGGFKKYDYTKGDHNFEVLTTNGTVYTNNADVFLFASGPGERIITSYTNDVFDPEKASLQYINNTIRQNFSYLELPIFVRYKVIDRTIGFNVIGGISYNLLLDNSVYTMIDGGRYPIGTTEGLNPISISSSLGMGMEYKFSEKLSLNLEPTFRYYMNPYSHTAGTNIHPYSFGIFSGVSYKF